MAKRTILIDDLDGTELPEDARSTTFALNGKAYSIDLSDKNAAALEKALSKYVDAAKPLREVAPAKRSSNTRSDSKNIRAWAAEQGLLKAGSRGRIPADVVEKYDAAH